MDFAWLWALIGAGVGAYFGGYLKTKGKNLATREDIKELKEQVAMVTRTTEEIKTEIADAAWNRKRVWELKREVLFEATKRLAEVDDALLELNTTVQQAVQKQNPQPEEVLAAVAERCDTLKQAAMNLSKANELVAIVCGNEPRYALAKFNQIALDISVNRDPNIYSKSQKLLWESRDAARAAVRKELGIDA
jgi:hypothetical protein